MTLLPVASALLAAYGVHLLFGAVAYGWHGILPGPRRQLVGPGRRTVARFASRLGLGDAPLRELSLAATGGALAAAAIAFAAFGGPLAPLMAIPLGAWVPFSLWKAQRRRRLQAALEAWPAMLEELRLRTATLGWSIPQALFEVGRNGPEELRPSFAQAERQWLISTDFERTIDSLKEQLADPAADAALETLLVAHEVGGRGLDPRLSALVADRARDVEIRRDARAKQSGVRFARRFVLAVPAAMAAAGMSIGSGRLAYETAWGQAAVVAAAISLAICWLWATALLRLPAPERLFAAGARPEPR